MEKQGTFIVKTRFGDNKKWLHIDTSVSLLRNKEERTQLTSRDYEAEVFFCKYTPKTLCKSSKKNSLKA